MTFDIFARLPAAYSEGAERKLIEFRVGQLRCALDIMTVREIVNPAELTHVPGAPRYMIGATDHRDSLVPVIDMRRRLGMETSESRRAKWIIVKVHDMDTALLVDSVEGVTTVNGNMERERHPLMESADETWVGRVYRSGEGMLFELDIDVVAGGVENASLPTLTGGAG